MDGHEAPSGYTVTRRLGSDASAMFLAREEATGQSVTLRFTGTANTMVRDRLIAAAPTLRAVDHPHVIPFLDIVEGPAGLVVVLGAAEGGSLAGILGARGVLPAGEVVTACAPVAEGLSETHRRGLIHGDLTLDDIVFTLDGRPMIAGIGLVQAGVAIRTGQPTRPIPPEVQAGSRPGSAADVYGLVTAAVAALTGYLPTTGPSLPHIAPAAEALLVSALDPNPQRRPSAANVGNVFFAIAEPTPVELVLEESHATTGSMPPVTASSAEPVDDVAEYMRRSTSVGRRARRRAETNRAADQQSDPGQQGAGEQGSGAAAAAASAAPSGAGRDQASRRGRRAAQADRRESSAEEGHAAPGDRSAAGGGPVADERPGRDGRSGREGRRAKTGRDDADASSIGGLGGRWHVAGVDAVWIVSALVAVLVVAGAVIVGMQMFGEDNPQAGPGTGSSPVDTEASTDLCGGPQPAPTAAPARVTDWTQEVQRLYSLRAQAFAESNPELLCQVHAPTNPVLAEDAGLLEEYADAEVRTEGLEFQVVNAELVSLEGGRATVSITQRIPDYRLVDESGNVEQEIEGTPEDTWEATLVAVADEGGETSSWRFG